MLPIHRCTGLVFAVVCVENEGRVRPSVTSAGLSAVMDYTETACAFSILHSIYPLIQKGMAFRGDEACRIT